MDVLLVYQQLQDTNIFFSMKLSTTKYMHTNKTNKSKTHQKINYKLDTYKK